MCVVVDDTNGIIGMPPSVWAKELAMDGERRGKSCVTRIGVIDNDVWSCRAIATWVAGLSGFVVDWCAVKASEGLYRALYGTTAPDVVLVDMALGGVSGVEVCRRICRYCCNGSRIGGPAPSPAMDARRPKARIAS